MNSSEVSISNAFGQDVFRTLQAIFFILYPPSKDIQLKVVQGAGAGLDVLFQKENRKLLMSKRWFEFETAHEESICELGEYSNGDWSSVFYCDHIVECLLDLILEELRPLLQETEIWFRVARSRARNLIGRIPRGIQLSNGTAPNSLVVSWTSTQRWCIAKQFGHNIRYDVLLHSMNSCESRNVDLVYQGGKS